MGKITKILIVLGILMATVYAGKWFIQTDYFNIKEIQITGDNAFIKDDIVNKVENLKNKNIVYMNTNEIEKTIKEDARVKKVSILKIFPSKLNIELEERKPHVYVRKGTDILVADNELNIFGYISELKEKNLPIVDYTDSESMKDLKIIVSKIKNRNFYEMISEIKKSNKPNTDAYEIVLLNGTIVETDPLVSTQKYEAAYAVYEKSKKERVLNYMNIRFKDIVVK